jgi:mRNA interferase RelE/StbE
LAYELTYASGVVKQLKKLDRAAARRILDYMDRVAELGDPRSRGKGLSGELRGIWRYRVKDYRVLCRIDDVDATIHVVDAEHRRRIYE